MTTIDISRQEEATMVLSYSELITIPTFEERYRYLRLGGKVGEETFGYYRYLNQVLYTSKLWRDFRRDIIVRDVGCDLGISDRAIGGFIIIHHLNPISLDDILKRNLDVLVNPENAICVSHNTHQAIHYGDESLLITAPIERSKNDTCPWRR
jgi:hypothetical protein